MRHCLVHDKHFRRKLADLPSELCGRVENSPDADFYSQPGLAYIRQIRILERVCSHGVRVQVSLPMRRVFCSKSLPAFMRLRAAIGFALDT